MADIKRCDACEAAYDPYNQGGNLSDTPKNANSLRLIKEKSNNFVSIRKYDLCPDCMKKLKIFLKVEEGDQNESE